MAPTSDLPEAAGRRLAEGSFSSGLSVPDFAACLSMGLEPLGLVQGFCAMQWGAYGGGILAGAMGQPTVATGGYNEVYQCPHGFVTGEHRASRDCPPNLARHVLAQTCDRELPETLVASQRHTGAHLDDATPV